jgi:formyl-CoA transferase
MQTLPMHHVVPRMMGTPGSIRTPAPALGQHNEALLAEVGIDGAAYRRLVDAGVVSAPSNHEAETSE